MASVVSHDHLLKKCKQQQQKKDARRKATEERTKNNRKKTEKDIREVSYVSYKVASQQKTGPSFIQAATTAIGSNKD